MVVGPARLALAGLLTIGALAFVPAGAAQTTPLPALPATPPVPDRDVVDSYRDASSSAWVDASTGPGGACGEAVLAIVALEHGCFVPQPGPALHARLGVQDAGTDHGLLVVDASAPALPSGPSDVRTGHLVVVDRHADLAALTGLGMGDTDIVALGAREDGGLWCLDVLSGAPLLPAGPAESLCVREDAFGPLAGQVPFFTAPIVAGTNPVRLANDALAPLRVVATLDYTYDCGALVAPTMGAALTLQVEDAAGTVASGTTQLPGMGQAVAFALLASGQDPSLCD